MRASKLLLWACAVLLPFVAAQAPTSYQPIASVAQIMLSMSYPMSDELLYVERNPPKTDSDWNKLQYAAVVMGESGNLLMIQRLGTPRDQEGWIKDCKLLVDAGAAALKAARAHDLPALLALNGQIVDSCTTCHADYRPNYRRRPPLSPKP
ncbi:MAG TPA: hypothetical protein VKV17_09725 [Bryobacteraceae bacterium]|nr:hypothetical protein [Bryobacteraceae bacterium]